MAALGLAVACGLALGACDEAKSPITVYAPPPHMGQIGAPRAPWTTAAAGASATAPAPAGAPPALMRDVPPEATTAPPATRPAGPAPGVLVEAEQESLSDLVQLTRGFGRAGEAYFSPDMKWIIFQATPPQEQQYQMYLAPLRWDGDRLAGAGDPIRISPENSRNTCGYFGPDNALIFASTVGKEKPDEASPGFQRKENKYRWTFQTGMEIYRWDDWRRLATVADNLRGGGGKAEVRPDLKPLTNNNTYDAECAFSPDGRSIVFCSLDAGNPDVYVMPATGGERVRITDFAGYDGGPFFAPDGKRLVYRSGRKDPDLLQVFVADLRIENGRITGRAAERQITDDANVNWGPFWHPDNRHIVFATSRHGHQNYELYLIRDDGTHPTRLTHAEGADVLPVFSPDGKWLMWTNKRTQDRTTQVFAARFRLPAGS